MPSVVEEAKELIGRPDVRLMSLMDHTPGQRQFRDEVKLRDYYRGKGGGMTDAELDVLFERRFAYQKAYAATNMRAIVALAQQYEIPLASHDDTTDENVTDADPRPRFGGGISDHDRGRARAAPGRHRHPDGRAERGARRLAFRQHRRRRSRPRGAAGHPVVRLHPLEPADGGAAIAAARVPTIDLASAIRTVTKTPAEAVGLADRGEIAAGKRADLIRVHVARDIPVVRSVWREGHRVA